MWPTLYFGAINLWKVVPAGMYYSSHDEQVERVWGRHDPVHAHQSSPVVQNDNPVHRRMIKILSAR
jgi:hypothetical protein